MTEDVAPGMRFGEFCRAGILERRKDAISKINPFFFSGVPGSPLAGRGRRSGHA
jgi:hypothetical protein